MHKWVKHLCVHLNLPKQIPHLLGQLSVAHCTYGAWQLDMGKSQQLLSASLQSTKQTKWDNR